MVVDPARETIEMQERERAVTFGPGERATAHAFDDFTLDVDALLENL